MDEQLIEWLYQVSLGKVPCDAQAAARIDQMARESAPLALASGLAVALAELRQDLAKAEDAGDTMVATTAKRKVELVEDLLLQCLSV